MKGINEYKTPVIEVVRFEMKKSIMANTVGDGSGDGWDGDIDETGNILSNVGDGGDFPWDLYE